ncbi:hypothetical protein BV25DRAFT_1912238 [Artomyces pyxidatus]|uniref:Uncharacterized protein n=1 Tax=Artomyces pyxidatus TaxID=48021 RepID=A0ACB8TEM1_9AGAM|nr:hypothetical protein BV25DRAFT_1912238 [Artomyces pyxidatus]
MFSKTFLSSIACLALASSVHAHAAFFPQLGVQGVPVRSDVQRPSTATPCGTTNIASTLDTTTPVAAAANGSFAYTAVNFNAGKDGSRQVKTVKVDPTGTGKNFVAATMLVNGDLAPTSTGQQPILGQLPAGTKCTGGKSKNLCLVSFTSAGGFGNCGVVSQGGAAAAAGGDDASASASASNSTESAAPPVLASTGSKSGKKGGKKGKHGKKGKKAGAAKAAATQAARSWASRPLQRRA